MKFNLILWFPMPAKQMKSWRSETYVHFKMPPEIVRDTVGNVQYVYRCKAYVTFPFITYLNCANAISIGSLGAHLSASRVLAMMTAPAIFGGMQGSVYRRTGLRLGPCLRTQADHSIRRAHIT